MCAVTLLLLAVLSLSLTSCKPKYTTRDVSDTTPAENLNAQRLLGKWELVAGEEKRLPWLNRPEDFQKGRTLEFLPGNVLWVRRAGEDSHKTSYKFLDNDAIEIDMFKLETKPPAAPIQNIKARLKVTADELTLTDDKGRKERYRAIK